MSAAYIHMADTRTPEQRRRIMQSVKSADTKPEMIVRKTLHRMGYRYRLHVRGLPGTPDIIMPKHRVALFVHGCFWHGHNCSKGRLPKSRPEFWEPKIRRNKERDQEKESALQRLGWNVLNVWQCETKGDLEGLLRGMLPSVKTLDEPPAGTFPARIEGDAPQ